MMKKRLTEEHEIWQKIQIFFLKCAEFFQDTESKFAILVLIVCSLLWVH